MHQNLTSVSAPLTPEVGSVLVALAAATPGASLRLNDLCTATGLPTGHVGRHLRTLERERLVCYSAGGWRPTMRGARHAGEYTDAAGSSAAA